VEVLHGDAQMALGLETVSEPNYVVRAMSTRRKRFKYCELGQKHCLDAHTASEHLCNNIMRH
jgi:hypothetical protein